MLPASFRRFACPPPRHACPVPGFVPGLELNAAFYREVVAPAARHWRHSAGRLGWGSDVLGFDTERSTDHGWGPSIQLFVEDADVEQVRDAVERALPEHFQGWPVRYGWDEHPVEAHASVTTLAHWVVRQLGVDPRAGLTHVDWLLLPQQELLGIVRGAVYHDGLDELRALREQLAWYPADVARWMLACQWHRVAQEEAFVGRAAEVGDDLGSRLVAARLARELMRIWFLLEHEYWPYTKWFGTSFARLPGSGAVAAALQRAVAATTYGEREAALAEAFERTARRHNEAGVTEELAPAVRPFHARGYLVIDADRFADACRARVEDPVLRGLPLVGSVDQFVDSTDVLNAPTRASRLRALYDDVTRS
jgi:Domain of unknown function (DUF4037)